jgi:hypothetical protein
MLRSPQGGDKGLCQGPDPSWFTEVGAPRGDKAGGGAAENHGFHETMGFQGAAGLHEIHNGVSQTQ